MPGFPLDAILIFDNNALVSLCDYCCDAHKHLPFKEMVDNACVDISNTMDVLRRFAINGRIYTTPMVHDEFKPERGTVSSHSGFDAAKCDCLKEHVKAELEVLEINPKSIGLLRGMEQAPKKFGEELSRISDCDLSLVILALGLARELKVRVYVLTDEEDLRDFVSWARTRPEAKKICPDSHKIESLHSLTYMDGVHRECSYTTEFILQRHNHLLINHLAREIIKETTKGESITETMKRIYQLIQQSKEDKERGANGVAA